MAVGRGHGKLLLFGEHAAVYGHPALGIQLDEYLEVELEPGNSTEWTLPQLEPHEASLIRAALAALPSAPSPGVLRVRGTLPMSVGFGSSAAFCTALLRARGFLAAERELWEAAHRLERIFHGTPSGIDTGLSIYSGASILYPNPPALPERAAAQLPNAWLVFGAIPRTRSTAELVGGIRELRERDPERVQAALTRLGELTRLAASSDACPDSGTLGRLAEEAHTILASLDLSTDELERTIDTLREAGATGAKLSGAGGGGAFFGVYAGRAKAQAALEAVRRTLEGSGARPLHLAVTRIGSRA